MVFAVYMPPQLPVPDRGAFDLEQFLVGDASAAWPPTASNTETMSRRFAPG
jgi:hypothetical protein